MRNYMDTILSYRPKEVEESKPLVKPDPQQGTKLANKKWKIS